MFIGNAETTIDDKGRLALARKWHLELAPGFIMTRGIDSCVCIFAAATFEIFVRNLGLSIASSDVRIYARHLTAFAEQGTLDRQGRIVIPPSLRQFADMNDQVTIVGVLNRLELWDSKKFAEMNALSETSIVQVAEKIASRDHGYEGT